MEMFKRICEISVKKRLFNPIISTIVSGRGREENGKLERERERRRERKRERERERKRL